MRIRIAYKVDGQSKLEEGQISNFPRGLWGKLVNDIYGDSRPWPFQLWMLTGAVLSFFFHWGRYGLSNRDYILPHFWSLVFMIWQASHIYYPIFSFLFGLPSSLGDLCKLVQSVLVWKCGNQNFAFWGTEEFIMCHIESLCFPLIFFSLDGHHAVWGYSDVECKGTRGLVYCYYIWFDLL